MGIAPRPRCWSTISRRGRGGVQACCHPERRLAARLAVERLGELGEHDAFRFAAAAVMVTGAVWSHAKPSAAVLAAYEADPDLASMRLDFLATLRQVLEVLIAGLLARSFR